MAVTGATKILSLAAATATVNSTDAGQPLVQTGGTGDWELPYGATGAYFILDLTASSGGTGGSLAIDGKDEVSGKYFQINDTFTAVKTASTSVYVIYPSGGTIPGAGTGITKIVNCVPLPPKGRVRFVITDGTHTGTCSMTPLVDAG